MGDPRRSTASAPPRRGIPLLRWLPRQREGGGSPSPACTYGRIGWCPRRRCLGGGGAGGGLFGVGAAFSGGGALRSSSSSRATCWRSDPWWRRIWGLVFRTGRERRLLPASGSRSSTARWRSWRERAVAVVVRRQRLRRGAADGSCGICQGTGRSQAVVWRLKTVFVADAGGAAGLRSGSVAPSYCTFLSVFVLRTLYVVLC